MKTTLYGLAAVFSFYIAALQMAADKKEKKNQKQFQQPLFSPDNRATPVTGPFGIIYSRNTWSNTGDFITNGNTTAILNGGYINISSATSDNWDNTVHITSYQTKLEKWRFKLRFKIAAWAGDSYGLGFGLKSANANVQNDIMGFLQTTSSGTGGLYILKSGRTIIAAGPTALGVSLNDIIDMEGIFYDSVFRFTAHNITSGSMANISYTYASNGSTHVVPNTSYFSLMELGGIHQIQNIEISSEELTGANIATIGDSKTIGYFTNTFAGRYAAQLNRNYPAALINAGGADRVTNVLNRKDELLRLAANKYLLSIGSNDIRFGSTLNELQTNYDSLVRILQATGATVYHIVLPEDYTKALGVNLLAFKNWVAATYSAYYINVWDSMATGDILKGNYDTGDGVHLNREANDKIYEAIVTSNKLGGGVTLPVRLLSFDVTKNNTGMTNIHWKVDPFEQAEKYAILKSRDGNYFEQLISVPSNTTAIYNYTDNDLFPGINYYKLKMTESSGIISYSKVISVQNEQAIFELTGLQKLNGDEFLFYLHTPEPAMINWQVIEGTGRKMKQGNQQLYKGANAIKITAANLNIGVYYLVIIREDKPGSFSFPFLR